MKELFTADTQIVYTLGRVINKFSTWIDEEVTR